MIVGAGNYEVSVIDVDGRPKKVSMYMSEEHIQVLNSTNFRVIAGWEKRAGKTVTRVLCLGNNQAATLELTD